MRDVPAVLVNRAGSPFVNVGKRPTSNPEHLGEDRSRHEALVRAHYERLRRLCALLLNDRQEAEEIVQDVFMKAWEAERGPEPPRNWAAWLTRVAVNGCRDRHRAGWWLRFRRRSDPAEDLPLAARDGSPVDAAINEETRRRISSAFARLPGRQREVFMLRYIEDLSTLEIAAVLSLSPGSVKRHLFRAIHRLRGALGASR
jgi:RNA polymerase sigma-70 factor (ECF subfamily)